MAIRILGLKLSRWKQWIRVLKLEAKGATVQAKIKIAIGMVKAASEGLATPEQWRHRVKTCPRCPLFDKFNHRCRPVDENGEVASLLLGCGCSTTIKALFKKSTCWGDDNIPDWPHGWKRVKDSREVAERPVRSEE